MSSDKTASDVELTVTFRVAALPDDMAGDATYLKALEEHIYSRITWEHVVFGATVNFRDGYVYISLPMGAWHRECLGTTMKYLSNVAVQGIGFADREYRYRREAQDDREG